MSDAIERYASQLQRALPAGDGWVMTSSSLVPDVPDAPLFQCDVRGAVLLLPGDGVKPGHFRTQMEGLLKLAKAPPTPKMPVNPIPWNMLIVLMIFDDEFPNDMRTFIGNDRRPLTPQRFIQGGWVSLPTGEANFRTNRTPFETELLAAVQQAVGEAGGGAPPRRGPSPGPARPAAPGPPDLSRRTPAGPPDLSRGRTPAGPPDLSRGRSAAPGPPDLSRGRAAGPPDLSRGRPAAPPGLSRQREPEPPEPESWDEEEDDEDDAPLGRSAGPPDLLRGRASGPPDLSRGRSAGPPDLSRGAGPPDLSRGRSAGPPDLSRGRAGAAPGPPDLSRGRTAGPPGPPDLSRGRSAGPPDLSRGRGDGPPDLSRGRGGEGGPPDLSRGRGAGPPDLSRGRGAGPPDLSRGRAAGPPDLSRGRSSGPPDLSRGRGPEPSYARGQDEDDRDDAYDRDDEEDHGVFDAPRGRGAAPRAAAPGRRPSAFDERYDDDEDDEQEEARSPMRETVRVRRDEAGRVIPPPRSGPRRPPVRREDDYDEEAYDYAPSAASEDDDMRQLAGVLATTAPLGTWLIMLTCLAVYGYTWYLGGSLFQLIRFGAQDNVLVLGGEWWRLYTATFIHFGILHIAINMFSLFNIGPVLEKFYGNLTYLALYSVSGLAGSAAMLYFGGNTISGGASGALFGLCGALVVMGMRYRSEIPAKVRTAMTVGMLPVLGYNLVFGFLANNFAHEAGVSIRIGNAAHLGGLIAGMVFALLVPSPKMRPSALGKILMPLMLVLGLAPFVAEGYMLYSHSQSSALVTYSDSSGYSFSRPASLVTIQDHGAPVYYGDGFSLVVRQETAAKLMVSVDVERANLLKELQSAGMTVNKNDVLQAGTHRWLIADGTAPNGANERCAVTIEGRNKYTVVLVQYLPSAEATKALQVVLESFNTPGGAQPSSSRRNRPRSSGSPSASGSPGQDESPSSASSAAPSGAAASPATGASPAASPAGGSPPADSGKAASPAAAGKEK